MKSFLIYCSGANKKILYECPSEMTKFSCIGGTVLFTSIFAFFSSSYALYRTFSEYNNALYYSYAFGILWALMIFNLDRYILCSIKKFQNKIIEFIMLLPRLFLAVIIAITIAKPLEVRILENKIIRKIHENKIYSINNDIKKSQEAFQKATDEIDEYDELLYNNLLEQNKIPEHIKTLNTAYQECEKDYKQSYSEYHKREQQLSIERSKLRDQYYKIISDIRIVERNILSQKKIINDIQSLTNKKIKAISKLKRLEDELSVLKEKKVVTGNKQWRKYKLLEKLKKSIKDRKKECKNLENKLDSKMKTYQKNLQNEIKLLQDKKKVCIDKVDYYKKALDDVKTISENINNIAYTHTFITQLEALGDLTKVKYSTMWWVKIMIVVLFITIETTPVLLRFITSEGPYDRLYNSENEREINSFLAKQDYINKIEQLQYDESFKQQSKAIYDYYQMLTDANCDLICKYFKKLNDFRTQKLNEIFKKWDISKTYEDIEKEFMNIYSALHINFSEFINEILKNKNANANIKNDKKRMNNSEFQCSNNDKDTDEKKSFSVIINICLIIFSVMCILCCLILVYSHFPKKLAHIATVISILFAGISSLTSIATWLKDSIFLKKGMKE